MQLPSQAVHCPARVEHAKQAIAPPGPSARSQNKIALLPFCVLCPLLGAPGFGTQGVAKFACHICLQRTKLLSVRLYGASDNNGGVKSSNGQSTCVHPDRCPRSGCSISRGRAQSAQVVNWCPSLQPAGNVCRNAARRCHQDTTRSCTARRYRFSQRSPARRLLAIHGTMTFRMRVTDRDIVYGRESASQALRVAARRSTNVWI